MPPAAEIMCPRHPDHGMAIKRSLLPEECQMLTKGKGQVFVIECEFCGTYEWRFKPGEEKIYPDTGSETPSWFW
jgi:hypothetical protein